MKKKKIASRTLDRSRCRRRARRGASDDGHAQANHGYAEPPRGRYRLAQDEITQHGDKEIRKRGRRLHIAVVRPRQQQHVHDEKCQQARYTQPDIARGEHPRCKRQQITQGRRSYRTHALHALTQKHVSQRPQHDTDQYQRDRLQLQSASVRHVSGFIRRSE
jgi:hypothetical protein